MNTVQKESDNNIEHWIAVKSVRLLRSTCAAHRAQPALLVASVALHPGQVSGVFDDSPQMGLQLRLVPVFYHGQMVQDLLKNHKIPGLRWS